MFSVGPFYWTGILYLIFRNRAWFREVSSSGARPSRPRAPPTASERAEGSNSRSGGQLRSRHADLHRRPGRVAGRLLQLQRVAISFMPPSPQQSSSSVRVLIVETPVTWNYYPESVTVVIGVNNTVTWVSHSLSFDTVTGVNGTLRLGLDSPRADLLAHFHQPRDISLPLRLPSMDGRDGQGPCRVASLRKHKKATSGRSPS